jgi:hypothetical protein
MLIIIRYVKREIRSLTDSDREKFLDAAATIWQYSQEDGREKFGAKFTSIGTLVATHALSSNNVMCDEVHEGTGFFTHHSAFGNVFEMSVRTVDPSVTIPYWDFTIEGQEIYNSQRPPSYLKEITPIFSDTWFGDVDEKGHIIDSRWAHIAMPKQLEDESKVRNSYGYIRSYWNNNPDPGNDCNIVIVSHICDISMIAAVSQCSVIK